MTIVEDNRKWLPCETHDQGGWHGMSEEMKGVLYSLWLVFLGIYFLQGAMTGSLQKGGRGGRSAVWRIPSWARLACLLVAGSFAAAAVFVFMRAFPK